MFASEGTALRALTRPLRLALYKRSPLFEADVAAELIRLKAERPNAPLELAKLKLARENMPALKRAIWREAARRLASERDGGVSAERLLPAQQPPNGSSLPLTKAPRKQAAASTSSLSDEVSAMHARALTGEHRVYLSTPGGPGSLMETLHRLADQGLLKVENSQDDSGDPMLIFKPLAKSASRPLLADA